MELGPIFRALLHHRGRFVLIALEIALTLAIVANCLHLIGHEKARMERPTGLDEDNLLVVTLRPWSERFADNTYLEQVLDRDLAALRALPGVRAATAIHAVPLSGGGSSTGLRAEGSQGDTVRSPYFQVSTEATSTLGIEIAAGRDFQASDFPPRGLGDAEREAFANRANVLITQSLADKYFTDGRAVGRHLADRDGESSLTVVGIIRQMHGSWPLSEIAEDVLLVPTQPADSRRMTYLVRSQPGERATVQVALDATLLGVDPDRILRIEAMTEVKSDTYGFQRSIIHILVAVAALLVLVTALGIVGLTGFSVTERRRQIGTRRALGASRIDILRYFLVENALVTTVGLGIGVLLALLLDRWLRPTTSAPPLDLSILATGMLLLWLTGLLAALAPALRSTRVPPVIATRTV